MTTIELCTNNEALREWCGLNFSDVPEHDQDDAANSFYNELARALNDAGYETVRAKGQRSLCHGWNGANTFSWKCGPVGTFDALTSDQKKQISEIIDSCEKKAVATWSD